MNENESIILETIDDPSLEAVLAEVRPVGEMTTDERLERRRRQEMDAVFNRVLALLNGAGYSVSQFAEWAGGKKNEPSTATRMREIRKERDNDTGKRTNKPAKPVENSEPKPTEQGNGRAATKVGRKTPVINTRKTETPLELEEYDDGQQE
ncbi:MAG: hypothetical protein D6694_07500 [Gammaproteobacteria bacterium]|nr:MAG: hypothetical protein D6694_07500 [Gammaproteobacteria bacterium]